MILRWSHDSLALIGQFIFLTVDIFLRVSSFVSCGADCVLPMGTDRKRARQEAPCSDDDLLNLVGAELLARPKRKKHKHPKKGGLNAGLSHGQPQTLSEDEDIPAGQVQELARLAEEVVGEESGDDEDDQRIHRHTR